jgi:hypothetical protein
MTRLWTALMADVFDRIPLPLFALISLAATLVVALAWYFWPSWLPWTWNWRFGGRRADGRRDGRSSRWGRLRLGALRWRLRRRRRRKDTVVVDPEELPADALPDLPAEVFLLTADQLAAEGRFAEAVRERLRGMVRELIERGVLPNSPGWTVTELAVAASQALPPLTPPLRAAVDVFSEIWYGLRPATRTDDDAMRAHAEAVRQTVNATSTAGSAR